MGDDVINYKIQFGEKIVMARKKVTVERKPMKVKRTRCRFKESIYSILRTLYQNR